MKEQIDQQIKKGNIIFMGDKLPEDWYQGFLEWKSAWENHQSAEALFNMAYCYREGEGTQLDLTKALELYEKSYALGNKDALEKIYSVMLEACNYDGLSQDEALAKDNEFRNYYKRAIEVGIPVNEYNLYLLDRAPIIRKYAALVKAKDWAGFDRALANETDTSNEIVSDLMTARNLEVHFKRRFRGVTRYNATDLISNGSTYYAKSSGYDYKANIKIKNNSSKPVSRRVAYMMSQIQRYAITGLNPSETFSRNDKIYNDINHTLRCDSSAAVTVLDTKDASSSALFSVFNLPTEIKVDLKQITRDVKSPPTAAESKKERRKGIAVLVALLGIFLIYTLL